MSDQPLQPQPESPVKKSAPKGRLSVVAKSEAASVRAVEFVDQLDVQTQRQRQVLTLMVEHQYLTADQASAIQPAA